MLNIFIVGIFCIICVIMTLMPTLNLLSNLEYHNYIKSEYDNHSVTNNIITKKIKECSLVEVTKGEWVSPEICAKENCLIGDNITYVTQFINNRRMIWRPFNCSMRIYSPLEIKNKLTSKGRHIHFVGDSVALGLYLAFLQMLNDTTLIKHYLGHTFGDGKRSLLKAKQVSSSNDIIFVNFGAWLVFGSNQRYTCKNPNPYLFRVKHPMVHGKANVNRHVNILKVPNPSAKLNDCLNAKSQSEYIKYCGKRLPIEDTYNKHISELAIQSSHINNQTCYARCHQFAANFKSEYEYIKNINFGNRTVVWRTTQINLGADYLGYQNCIKYVNNYMARTILKPYLPIMDIEAMTESRPDSYVNELTNHFYCSSEIWGSNVIGNAKQCAPFLHTIFDSNDVHETVVQVSAGYL